MDNGDPSALHTWFRYGFIGIDNGDPSALHTCVFVCVCLCVCVCVCVCELVCARTYMSKNTCDKYHRDESAGH
jgi:hypothetical protein